MFDNIDSMRDLSFMYSMKVITGDEYMILIKEKFRLF